MRLWGRRVWVVGEVLVLASMSCWRAWQSRSSGAPLVGRVWRLVGPGTFIILQCSFVAAVLARDHDPRRSSHSYMAFALSSTTGLVGLVIRPISAGRWVTVILDTHAHFPSLSFSHKLTHHRRTAGHAKLTSPIPPTPHPGGSPLPPQSRAPSSVGGQIVLSARRHGSLCPT